ncbi:hypothetical protein NMY22_g13697 [Coprinellus aureogranulatus]|nr:hypothetical protein NMY22_g13697 [Coprinellus aureogranulatus]
MASTPFYSTVCLFIYDSLSFYRPVDPVTSERLTPCRFEEVRMTHDLQAPCCLCSLLDNTGYTEARIGIAEAIAPVDSGRSHSVLQGEYVATCAKQKCGYFLCLERFYTVRGLRLRKLRRRRHPLPSQGPTGHSVDVDKDKSKASLFSPGPPSASHPLSAGLKAVDPIGGRRKQEAIMKQLTTGMSEDRFWETFVQCLVCKDVTFRVAMASGNHTCRVARASRRQHWHPYNRSEGASSGHSSCSTTPSEGNSTSTESDTESENDTVNSEYRTASEAGDGATEDECEFINTQRASDDLGDEWEPPSLSVILENARRQAANRTARDSGSDSDGPTFPGHWASERAGNMHLVSNARGSGGRM